MSAESVASDSSRGDRGEHARRAQQQRGRRRLVAVQEEAAHADERPEGQGQRQVQRELALEKERERRVVGRADEDGREQYQVVPAQDDLEPDHGQGLRMGSLTL
ncbi:MAG: hypothetical protein V8S24_14610 [Gordonibacter pamelaeae]